MSDPRDSENISVQLNPGEQSLVTAQLDRLLGSPLFSQSKRYAPFLRYVVQKTLEGHADVLKERLIGVDVFGRSPDYDSNNDPIVRVTAGEVRKRIAQYYHDPAHHDEPGIELPTGTYVAQFRLHLAEHRPVESPETAPAVEPAPLRPVPPVPAAATARRPSIRLVVLAAVLLLAAAVGAWRWFARRTSPLNSVWASFVAPNIHPVIALGEPHASGGDQPAGEELTARQHLRSVDVAFSDLQALVRIMRLLDGRHGNYSVQPASNTSFADLRQAPAILLGGLDNPWMLRAQRNLRFQMQSDGNGVDWISDTHEPGGRKWSIDFNRPYSKVTTDYAIVARFRDPDTQQPTLIVAGLGENGTKAASEFITDEAQLGNSLSSSAKKDAGNFEIVLTTEVINGFTGRPRVLAVETW